MKKTNFPSKLYPTIEAFGDIRSHKTATLFLSPNPSDHLVVLDPFLTFCQKVFPTFQSNLSLYIILELKRPSIPPLSKSQPNFRKDLFGFVWEAFSYCIIFTLYSGHRWFNYHLIAKLLSNLVERGRKFKFLWDSNKKRNLHKDKDEDNDKQLSHILYFGVIVQFFCYGLIDIIIKLDLQ